MEAHGTSIDALYDRTKMAMFLATDRLHVLRQAIQTCRKGGTVSIPGVYGGLLDKVPMGAAFAKGLTLKWARHMCTNTYVHCSRALSRAKLIPPCDHASPAPGRGAIWL